MSKAKKVSANKTIRSVVKNYELYLFLIPAVVLTFCFCYIPMYGAQIAFKDYSVGVGIMNSPWVGLKHFMRFFNLPQFLSLIKNTLYLSFFGLLAGFPLPIILALLLNQMSAIRFKKVIQTVTYMPHFISLVVLVSMVTLFLSPTSGIYGNICRIFGVEASNILGNAAAFRPTYIISDLWQHTGWGSIIYLSALSAVDPSLYESAMVDGASKFKRIIYIDIPSIAPVCVTMLILSIGGIMSVGFDKAFLMQNSLNISTSEIIATYVYKVGIINTQYSMSAAVGLFNNIINFILLLSVNWIARKIADTSLF